MADCKHIVDDVGVHALAFHNLSLRILAMYEAKSVKTQRKLTPCGSIVVLNDEGKGCNIQGPPDF